jgi:ribosomal-protein-alanine N-acetyltransferase
MSDRTQTQLIAVRSMHAEDLDRVLAIAVALPTAPHWSRQVYLDLLNPSAHPPRLALLAEFAGRIAGFAILSILGPEAELESIAVAPEAQRQGVGRALLHAAFSASLSAGAATLLLEIRASNTSAAALYRQTGFRETGRRPGYYTDPKEDAILMARDLL